MPIHDWTKVYAGIFHDFHHGWIEDMKRSLNGGALPTSYYALAEQRAGDTGPDVLTLQADEGDALGEPPEGAAGGLALATAPPKVRYRTRIPDVTWYARKANRIAIRHVTGDRLVAVVELMSPGNKSDVAAIEAFVGKAQTLIRAGVHVLVVDLFPPTVRDPNGIHDLIWGAGTIAIDRAAGQLLTCAAYCSAPEPEAFVEPVGIGDRLPDMPLFLTADRYIPMPLETTYQSAFEAVPARAREPLMS